MPAGADAVKPPFLQELFCLSRGECVPFSTDHKEGGQLFSGGALISIADAEKLQPSIPY